MNQTQFGYRLINLVRTNPTFSSGLNTNKFATNCVVGHDPLEGTAHGGIFVLVTIQTSVNGKWVIVPCEIKKTCEITLACESILAGIVGDVIL